MGENKLENKHGIKTDLVFLFLFLDLILDLYLFLDVV